VINPKTVKAEHMPFIRDKKGLTVEKALEQV